ncbi:MAG: tyrosine-type recombinase/integrase [Candidatus Aminicenantales bacterium]
MKIYKRGGIYYLDLTIGKKRHRPSLGVDEYGLALDRAREKERELRAIAAGKPTGGLTFDDFLPRYAKWAKATKPKTFKTEAYYLKAMIAYFAGLSLYRLADVTPEHVEKFRVWIREQDRRTHPKEGSAPIYPGKSTVNRYCACLRKFYNLAWDYREYEGENPLSRVKFYRENGKRRPLTADELGKVIAAARKLAAEKDASPAQRAMPDLMALSINTGLRKTEALKLRRRDVRENDLEIVGKGEKPGTVPLNAEARAVIERQPEDGQYVFDVPNRDKREALRSAINRIQEVSGVHHFGFHLCRHYFGSELMAKGVDLETVSRLMRHSRMMTTLLYTHSTPERMRSAVDLIGTNPRHRPPDVKQAKSRKVVDTTGNKK